MNRVTRNRLITVVGHLIGVFAVLLMWYAGMALVGVIATLDPSMLNPTQWHVLARGWYAVVILLSLYKFVQLTHREW